MLGRPFWRLEGWLGLSVSQEEEAALGYQPAPGNPIKNPFQNAAGQPKTGD